MKLENPPKKSIEDAITEISLIQREIYMMGGNDYEIPATIALIEKLQRGEISGEEAIKIANKIMAGKTDYH